jgi:hypothetical protein
VNDFHFLLAKLPPQFIGDRHGDNGLLNKQPASPTPEKRFPPDVTVHAVTVRTFKGRGERVRFTGFLIGREKEIFRRPIFIFTSFTHSEPPYAFHIPDQDSYI